MPAGAGAIVRIQRPDADGDPPGAAMRVTLRPVQPDDDAFLCALYGSTRQDELAAWGWGPAERDAFLRPPISCPAAILRPRARAAPSIGLSAARGGRSVG